MYINNQDDDSAQRRASDNLTRNKTKFFLYSLVNCVDFNLNILDKKKYSNEST